MCEHSQRRSGRRESPIRSAWRRTQVPERGCSCQSRFGPKSVAWPSSSPEVASDYGASTHAEPGVSSFGHLADGGADDRVPVAVCLRRPSALPRRVSGVSLISLAAVVPLAILALVGRQSMGQQVLSVPAWAIGGAAVTLVATVVYSVVVMTLILDMIPIAEAPLWGSTSLSIRTDPPILLAIGAVAGLRWRDRLLIPTSRSSIWSVWCSCSPSYGLLSIGHIGISAR